MINDVLEQLAEDYFRHKGYFTQHNVKYRPNLKGPAYSVHSDIDIIGVLPKGKGIKKVIVVSCKSWHSGLHIKRILKDLSAGNKRKAEKSFREIAMPVWSVALKNKVKELTGKSNFTFYIACTSFSSLDRELWELNKVFKKNLKGCEIKLINMRMMVEDVWGSIKNITPAHSELSRLLQMIYHSKGDLIYK